MVARLPEQENICSPRMLRWRAAQLVMVPLSVAMIASSVRSLFSSCATTCGFIGTSCLVPRSSISVAPVLHPGLRLLEEGAVRLAAASRGSRARSVRMLSPTSAASTG